MADAAWASDYSAEQQHPGVLEQHEILSPSSQPIAKKYKESR